MIHCLWINVLKKIELAPVFHSVSQKCSLFAKNKQQKEREKKKKNRKKEKIAAIENKQRST